MPSASRPPTASSRGAGTTRLPSNQRELHSVPHEVTSVAAGILHQVLLVIILGGRERTSVHDFGDDGPLPRPACLRVLLGALGLLTLLRRGHEDGRTVLT